MPAFPTSRLCDIVFKNPDIAMLELAIFYSRSCFVRI